MKNIKNVNREYSLDFLKILSCIGVIVLHTFNKNDTIPNRIILSIFSFSIPMFFLVNGYLLLNKEQISYKYIIKKILNILAIILVFNFAISMLNFIIKYEWENVFTRVIQSVLQNGYFYQFWFLGSLIMIYWILPIMHKIFTNLSKRKNLIVLSCLFVICVLMDSINIMNSYKHNSMMISIPQTFRIWTWLFYFILGGYLKKYVDVSFIKGKKYWFVLVLCILIIFQLILGQNVYRNLSVEYFYDNIFTIIYVILIFLTVKQYENKLNIKTIEMLSSAIMVSFILHTTFIYVIYEFYKFNNIFLNILLVIFIYFICIVLAKIINKTPVIKSLFKI